MTTSTGQKVTVDESSSTKYKKGSNSISASAIKKGTHVLVIGTVSSTTIKATQVIVQTGSSTLTASTAATVVPFQQGSPTTSKQVGQIPTSYTEGSGTIVSGTAATKATEAALAAYPGGVVDRVVKLSNGEYEVHTSVSTGPTTSSSTRTSRSSAPSNRGDIPPSVKTAVLDLSVLFCRIHRWRNRA